MLILMMVHLSMIKVSGAKAVQGDFDSLTMALTSF